VLLRQVRSYVKGRDWFDLMWYASVKARVNHELLSAALDQQGPWSGRQVKTDDAWVRNELLSVLDRMDWNTARRDVLPFVYASDRPSVDLWSREFFSKIVEGLFNEVLAKPCSSGEARTPPLRRCGVSPHHDGDFASTSNDYR